MYPLFWFLSLLSSGNILFEVIEKRIEEKVIEILNL